jgi:hypothetical protein
LSRCQNKREHRYSFEKACCKYKAQNFRYKFEHYFPQALNCKSSKVVKKEKKSIVIREKIMLARLKAETQKFKVWLDWI